MRFEWDEQKNQSNLRKHCYGQPMKNYSESDWARVDAMADEDIDTSDIPPLTESFFQHARVRMPKRRVNMQIDADLLQWFQSQGEDYERRMNAALRLYVEAHEVA
jgi:uncharacterized protein (DUF4415 family)